ncbi:MAG: hypothetical protein WD359_01670 [Dehalococcoidia bacterium]
MGSGRQLTSAEWESIEPVLEELSSRAGYRQSLDRLKSRWRSFVGEVEIGYNDSADEYTNDLSTRDLLQRVMDAAPAATCEKIRFMIARSDARFEDATVSVATPIRDRPGWWWGRIPKVLRGDLRQSFIDQGVEVPSTQEPT